MQASNRIYIVCVGLKLGYRDATLVIEHRIWCELYGKKFGGWRLRGRRIVFVINAAVVGGAERHAATLSRGLEARGFLTSVFPLRGEPNGIDLTFAQQYRALRAHLRQSSNDLVVAVNERPAVVAALAGRSRKAKVVAILHSTLPRTAAERTLRIAYLPALYTLDRVIFVSELQRRYWRRGGLLAKSEAIRNGVDTSRFAPDLRMKWRDETRAALGFADTDIVAALCAVLRPEKNAEQFLVALASLRGEGKPVKGLLIGDGPCFVGLRERISKLSIGNAVALVGMREDVRPYLSAADFGLNCSLTEALSLSALETLAMGLPMVMSDIGGAREIVDGSNGVLFRLGDLGALQLAMNTMIDPDRRRHAGTSARARAVAEFDESKMFDRYAETFSMLTG